MRLCHIICLSLLVGTGVFCLPVDTTEHPPPSLAQLEVTTAPSLPPKPKREDAEALCCGTHVNKRAASCCGADSPKGCCGADGDPKCCGGQKSAEDGSKEAIDEGRLSRDLTDSFSNFGKKSWFFIKNMGHGIKDCASNPKACLHFNKREATKPKRGVEGVGNQNESSCCGKNRAARALGTPTTAKPAGKASPETPPEVTPVAPLITPIRVAREENKSCCGADVLKKVEKPKRSAHEAVACCGGSASKPLDAPGLDDKAKARTTREACCGLKGDEAKKCCGAEAPSAPGQETKIRARRCDQTTVIPIQ